MIFELASVEDRGAYWLVTNVTKNSLDRLATNDEKYIKLSYVVYKQIQDALIAGKQVRIQKSLKTDEVLPGEIQIVETNNHLEATKESSFIKLKNMVTMEMSKISGFVIYSFTVLNNELADKGYFITDYNREEKYIEIIETMDEVLINKLEEYLNAKDEIERVSNIYKRLTKFKDKLSELSTIEEVQELETKFITDFYTYI
jgi:hypothetical protein